MMSKLYNSTFTRNSKYIVHRITAHRCFTTANSPHLWLIYDGHPGSSPLVLEDLFWSPE